MTKTSQSFKGLRDKVRSMEWGRREFKQHESAKEGSIMSVARTDFVTINKRDSIKHASDKMAANNVRRVFVTSANNELEGMVSATDIVDFLGGGDKFEIVSKKHFGNLKAAANESVRLIMNEHFVSIKNTDSVEDAIIKMHEKNVGSLPVLKGNKLVGVITERDFVKLISKYLTEKKVKEFMTKNVILGTSGMTLGDIAKVMVRNGFRRIPIVSEGELVGVLTTTDLVRAFSKNPNNEVLEIMAEKIMNKPLTIKQDDFVSDAAELMQEKNIGGLQVVDGRKLIGLITERDLFKIVGK